MKIVSIKIISQHDQPTTSDVHIMSTDSQYDELKAIKENMKSCYVPLSSTVAEHEKFDKFVPSSENSVTLLP